MLKSFWFWILILFLSIQIISMDIPSKLNSKPENEIVASKEVMNILQRSCYDCHSSRVKEPWYYNVAPASWYTQLHVKNGRAVVNFSEWNNYSKEKQLKVLDKLPKSIVIRMPLLTYTYLHEESKLSNIEKKTLAKWARRLKEKIK